MVNVEDDMDCVGIVTPGTGPGATYEDHAYNNKITTNIEQCNSHGGRVITVILPLNGPAPTLVYALICTVYTSPDDNPSIVPISESVKLTSDAILLTLYCTSYCMIIPLGVSGSIHDKITNVDWIISDVSERGAVAGPSEKKTSIVQMIDQYVFLRSCPDNPVTGSLNGPVPLTLTAATSTE